MNKLFLIFTILFANVILGQTENETIEFINGKFRTCSHPFSNIDGSEDPTLFTIETTWIGGVKLFSISLDIDGPFHMMVFNPKNIIDVVEYRAPDGTLNIKIIDKMGTVLTWFVGDETKKWATEINIVLECSDIETRRLKNALIHLFKINDASLLNNTLFDK